MIEIVHLKRRDRPITSVFGLEDEFYTVKNYKARYHAGREKPHYSLPTHYSATDYEALIMIRYLMSELFGG